MPDIADRAQDFIELYEELKRKEVSRLHPEAMATGRCLFCDEIVRPPNRWCDADCRDDWERRKTK